MTEQKIPAVLPAQIDARIYVIAEFESTRALPPGPERVEAMARDFLGLRVAGVGAAGAGGHALYHSDRAGTKRGGSQSRLAVWEKYPEKGMALNADLHPSVVAVLGGQAADGRRIPALRLSTIGRNLLNGEYIAPPRPETEPGAAHTKPAPVPRGFRLELHKGAQRRLGFAPGPEPVRRVEVEIVEATILFPSNFGVIVFELDIKDRDLSPGLIQEALHLLTNRNRRDACGFLLPDGSMAHLSIADLMGATCPKEHCQFESWNRLYTYTAVTLPAFDGTAAEQHRLAFKLARRYTADYAPSDDQIAATIYQPFTTIIHAFSLEGAATVVDGSTDFLEEQFGSRIRQGYLPLVTLAYHEHAYLIDMVHEEHDRDQFAKRIERFLDYRLRYRLPLVSDLDMHNTAYNRLRHSLHNDALIEKLARDSTDTFQFLVNQAEEKRGEAQRRRKRERYRKLLVKRKQAWQGALLPGFLLGGLMFLAFSNIVERIAVLMFSETAPSAATRFWALMLGLLAGVGACILQCRRVIDQAQEDLDDAHATLEETGGDDDPDTGSIGIEDRALDEGDAIEPQPSDVANSAAAAATNHPS